MNHQLAQNKKRLSTLQQSIRSVSKPIHFTVELFDAETAEIAEQETELEDQKATSIRSKTPKPLDALQYSIQVQSSRDSEVRLKS